MIKKAYSYLRMSTQTQLKGDSLRRQLAASEEYARSHELQLVEQFEDIGVSAFRGKNSEKGALATFLEMIDQGYVEKGSYLLVESLDRLSRENVLKALPQFISIVQAGITIVTLADNQTYTEESLSHTQGQLFVTLGIMFRANEESATKSKRLKQSCPAPSKWSNPNVRIGFGFKRRHAALPL